MRTNKRKKKVNITFIKRIKNRQIGYKLATCGQFGNSFLLGNDSALTNKNNKNATSGVADATFSVAGQGNRHQVRHSSVVNKMLVKLLVSC